jgi:signal transduction histidine kinase
LHDAAFGDDPDDIEAAAGRGFGHRDLMARMTAALEETRASRARMVAAGDRGRRLLERDLHDGAQQRLIALALRLETLAHELDEDAPRAAEKVRALGADVQAALEEIRRLGHGLYPATLADNGLGAALRAEARRLPVPATVECRDGVRYPPEIELAVYFCVMEALQNVAKHAAAARKVTLSLREERGSLVVEITDDGPGFRPGEVGEGAGIASMKDRLEVVSGELTVDAAPGRGVRVVGAIPLDAPRAMQDAWLERAERGRVDAREIVAASAVLRRRRLGDPRRDGA